MSRMLDEHMLDEYERMREYAEMDAYYAVKEAEMLASMRPEGERTYEADPDEYERPGTDAYTDSLRGGFRWDVV